MTTKMAARDIDSVPKATKRPRKSYFCGHCLQEVFKTLFFKHKKLYYNKHTREWSKERVTTHCDFGDDFEFAEAEALERENPVEGDPNSAYLYTDVVV